MKQATIVLAVGVVKVSGTIRIADVQIIGF